MAQAHHKAKTPCLRMIIVQPVSPSPIFLENFSAIPQDYDAVFCDIWGVLHNGVAAFPDAVAVLAYLRARRIPVILITNAPRPSAPIIEQLADFGITPDLYTTIVTSGDISIGMIAEFGEAPLYHIGPDRDRALFEAVYQQTGLMPELVMLEEATYCVCTGLFEDDNETPEDYREEFQQMLAKNMVMICGNPDIVVHRGHHVIYCAGALAQLYQELGGVVRYAGKPHSPIYARALALAHEELDRHKLAIPKAQDSTHDHTHNHTLKILAIGDALHTDVLGAKSHHHRCVFIAGGIHANEFLSNKAAHITGTPMQMASLDHDKILAKLNHYAKNHNVAPVDYVLPRLFV